MSGSTIGGVVGGAIGWFIGGPTGAYYGWMIGSAVGGYVDPEQIKGPRLSDARTQTSRDGVVIPYGWGRFPTAGNIIWQQPGVTEHKKTERQGKGGPEVTTYTYTRSYAVAICEGPITGLLQIKRNGKLVYDSRDDATLLQEYEDYGIETSTAQERVRGQRAMNTKLLDNAIVYTGTETQSPDPTIEEWLGVNNVPSYRGIAYIVFTDDDVTDLQGAIPQYEFVVSVCGEVTTVPGGVGANWIIGFPNSPAGSVELSPDGLDWSASGFTPSPPWAPNLSAYSTTHEDNVLLVTTAPVIGTVGVFSSDGGTTWSACTGLAISGSGGHCVFSGGHWHVADTFHDMQRSANGIAFSSVATAPAVRTVAVFNSKLYAANAADVYVSDISGAVWASDSTVTSSFSPQSAMMDASGAVLGYVCHQAGEFGVPAGDDIRCHIFSKGANDIVWTEQTSPFADEINPAGVPRSVIHYSVALGIWVVSFFDRVAYGASLTSLTLSSHVFPEFITSIDSDAGKIIASGNNGLLEWTTDGNAWTPLTAGVPTVNIYTVSSFWGSLSQTPIPDAPGWFVNPDGSISGPAYDVISECFSQLSEIVADVCDREGLTPDEYDVSQLTDIVPGFRVAVESDGSAIIGTLAQSYFFDVGEWDGKIRFIKRGGTSLFAINDDDLVQRDGDSFEQERTQEAELLRRVTVGYIDPIAGYGPTTQKWERRAGTVRAYGESSIELPLTLDGDDAAAIAAKRGLVAWGEPEKQRFSLPYRLTAITPTDIGTYTDASGVIHYVRVMQADDDSGVRLIESATNSPEAYEAVANGVSPKAPTVTDDNTTLAGPTVLLAMNLDSLREQDNVAGMYFAANGQLTSWPGCTVEMSTDGGISYEPIATITVPAKLGYLTAEIGLTTEPIPVFLYANGQLSSVVPATSAGLEPGINAAAIISEDIPEIIQFETATAGGNGNYEITSVIRGVGDTVPDSHIWGSDFVLLDTAVIFVPLDASLSGTELFFKGVTLGTSSDAASAISVVYEPPSFVIDGGAP